MDYARAKEIFKKCNYNYSVIEELGLVPEYSTYKVTKEQEMAWARERIDEEIEKLRVTKDGDFLEFDNEVLYLVHTLANYFSKEEIITLYDVMKNKMDEIHMPKTTQLHAISIFYDVLDRKNIKDNPEYISILKDILRKYKSYLASGEKFAQARYKEYDFFNREANKYINRK
jgi:hypothetical protein